jgi:uncharacterized small protein (DUF1192 family)
MADQPNPENEHRGGNEDLVSAKSFSREIGELQQQIKVLGMEIQRSIGPLAAKEANRSSYGRT